MKFEYKKWFLENPNFKEYWTPNESALWNTSDNEDTFKKHLNKYPKSPHLRYYIENPITYSFNNYGFRTPDNFNLKEDGNVFLGCSNTFGVGHHLESVWAYKLSQKIGGKFYNISEPGCGIMTQYRYLNYFKDKIKFKNVFHYLPNEVWGRYEKINNDDKFEAVYLHDNISNDLLDFVYNDKSLHFITYIFIDAIRYMLNEIGVNYYLITKSGLTTGIPDPITGLVSPDPYHPNCTPARDLMHYYVEEHDDIFNIFYHKYLNKITDNTDNVFLINESDCRDVKFI